MPIEEPEMLNTCTGASALSIFSKAVVPSVENCIDLSAVKVIWTVPFALVICNSVPLTVSVRLFTLKAVVVPAVLVNTR